MVPHPTGQPRRTVPIASLRPLRIAALPFAQAAGTPRRLPELTRLTKLTITTRETNHHG